MLIFSFQFYIYIPQTKQSKKSLYFSFMYQKGAYLVDIRSMNINTAVVISYRIN